MALVFDPITRYRWTRAFVDDAAELGVASATPVPGSTYFGTREPISFIDDRDNFIHLVEAGDTLESLAERFFDGFPDAANMWWVLAEFQPTPIQDPTLRLRPGSMLIVPSSTIVSNLVAVEPPSESVVA